MALLYRFTKLNDRANTGIFTFIVTRSVTRDFHRDATTKDFCYGYHRWAVSFTRANDKVLGVYLILRNPSAHTKCFADFTFTLINREHFSKNEVFSQKQCKFMADHPAQGISKWIPLTDIQNRKFGDETGEFLLELSLGNTTTVFETDLQLSQQLLKSAKIETSYFTFGSFDWNVLIVASTFGDEVESTRDHSRPFLYLNRLTGLEHPCRVQYRVILREGKFREDSGVLDQISDAAGRIRGFQMRYSLTEMIKHHGVVHVYVELHCCNTISEAKVPIVRNPSPSINCYDRNKQGWCIEADLESEHLRLKLFFMDLHSVPRNHLRYISWIAYVVTRNPRSGLRESIVTMNAPHGNFYIQDGIDMGVTMETDIRTHEIKESPKVYLEMDGFLTVHIEWCDSLMLFNHIYHKYDDISRIHCHQMRREIAALTSENYNLERQLFTYQKSSGPNNMAPAIPSRVSMGQRSSSDAYLHDNSLRYFSSNHSLHLPHSTHSPGHHQMTAGQHHYHHQNHRSAYDRNDDQHSFVSEGHGQSLSESEYA